MAGLLDSFGQGLQGAGAILSDRVYDTQARERAEMLPNMMRALEIKKAQATLKADEDYTAAIREASAGLQPSALTTSAGLLDLHSKIPMDLLASSPRAQQTFQIIGKQQAREQAAEAQKAAIEAKKEAARDKATQFYDKLEQRQYEYERDAKRMELSERDRAEARLRAIEAKEAMDKFMRWSVSQGLEIRREALADRRAAAADRARTDDVSVAPPSGETAVNPNVKGASATGGSGFFGNIANTVADAVGAKMPYPNVEQASQALTNLRIQTVTMAQDSIPGRPSNYLMQQLDKLAVKPNSIFMADQRAKVRLEQTRDMLKQEVDRMKREILDRPQQFKAATLSKTRNSYGQLRQLVSEYDTVISSFNTGGPTAAGKIGAPKTPPPPEGFKPD